MFTGWLDKKWRVRDEGRKIVLVRTSRRTLRRGHLTGKYALSGENPSLPAEIIIMERDWNIRDPMTMPWIKAAH